MNARIKQEHFFKDKMIKNKLQLNHMQDELTLNLQNQLYQLLSTIILHFL